jgi:hypothetical protein
MATTAQMKLGDNQYSVASTHSAAEARARRRSRPQWSASVPASSAAPTAPTPWAVASSDVPEAPRISP